MRYQVEAFANRMTVLPFGEAASIHSADIRATLERKGQVIGPHDLMIAGHARSVGLMAFALLIG